VCENDDIMDTASKVSAGFKARLEYVLDQVCVELADGGSHEMRSFVAESLIAAAQAGERSLEGLMAVAGNSLASYDDRRTAKSA
jgi:hypothetical protein